MAHLIDKSFVEHAAAGNIMECTSGLRVRGTGLRYRLLARWSVIPLLVASERACKLGLRDRIEAAGFAQVWRSHPRSDPGSGLGRSSPRRASPDAVLVGRLSASR